MPKTVTCMVKTHIHAEPIVSRIEKAGIEFEAISLVMPERRGNFILEYTAKTAEGAKPGNTNDVLSLLSGFGALTLHNAESFIVAGPIRATLRRSDAATRIGIADALLAFGLTENQAHQYEAKIKEGNVLLCIHTPDNDEAQRVREILENTDAHDVAITGDEDYADVDRDMSSVYL